MGAIIQVDLNDAINLISNHVFKLEKWSAQKREDFLFQ